MCKVVYGLAMSLGYLARVILTEWWVVGLMLDGWGKGLIRSGSNSISRRRLDRDMMRIVGGCDRGGLWDLVSAIATLRELEYDGLVKERLEWLLSIV